ncbi:MAG: TrkH family potassium uptake protein [Clostridia bacterium]|nr:TrkH family potassium uptake protein [Clostridia bacterium]
MNRKIVFFTVSRLILLEALLMILPLVVSLLYLEYSMALSFIISVGIAALCGGMGWWFLRPVKGEETRLYPREGFLIVALAWISTSVIGAVPFYISGEIPSFLDAFFETVSGFTTTGATILTRIEEMCHGALLWRSFTHWIGGMGVLVLMMALSPAGEEQGRTIHIMRAEMPGPIVGKLVPKVRETARLLYLLYIGLTILEVLFLLFGGMSLFEAVVHAFATAGTGGFGIRADSFASYSPYLQWTVSVFMLLFGVNFNIYYLLILRRFRDAFRNAELRCYFAIAVVATGILTVNLIPVFQSFGEAVRVSFFEVSSIMTTTGFGVVDINSLPGLSKAVLLLLMMIGACAGSTGGGLKVARVMLLFKTARRDLRRLLHPRSVGVVQMDGNRVEDYTLRNLSTFSALYALILLATFFILSFDAFDFETNFSAAVSCFNNIGPAYGAAASDYSAFSAVSKLALSFAMLFGRLEVFPLLLACSPSSWTKK